jgi:ketosteroid isomerase-like protein
MHKSRLAGFIIDCNTPELAAAADFWAHALRMEARRLPGAEGEKYVQLVGGDGQLHIEVQSVDHPSRVHLDVKSDDIEAEVARLEALGARRVAQVHTWSVMEAPTGQRFCVVRMKPYDTVVDRWHQVVATRDAARLPGLLADDVVFQSPAVHTPQAGKAVTLKYLEAALRVLANEHFRYVEEWTSGRSAVLGFTTRLGDVEVDGVDMLWWNDAGQITRFKVMVRPVKALQTLMPLMARELEA